MAKTEKITITKKEFESLCSAVSELSYIAYQWAPDEGDFRKDTIKSIDKCVKRCNKIKTKYAD